MDILLSDILQCVQKLTIYTDIYDIKLYFQNSMRANNSRVAGRSWPAGRSVDTLGVNPHISDHEFFVRKPS